MDSELALMPAIIFSDSVRRDETTGRRALVGIFHRFISSHVPFTSPTFFATAFVSNVRGQIQSLPLKIHIENARGEILSHATGEISAAHPVARHDVFEIAFPLPITTFPSAGQYKAVVFVDGNLLGHRPFNVELG
jgi:hypothetical protein